MSAKRTISRTLALCGLVFGVLFGLFAGAALAVDTPPTVATKAATGVTDTAATLNGTVSTNNGLSDCHFEYVTVAAYRAGGFSDLSSGGSANCVPAAATIPTDELAHDVSATVARPVSGEGLVYRLLATNGAGPAVSAGPQGHDEPFPAGVGFGLTSFDGGAFLPYVEPHDGGALTHGGAPDTRAGARPDTASTEFFLATETGGSNCDCRFLSPTQELKDVIVDLPAGLIGNATAAPHCTEAELTVPECPAASEVGLIKALGYTPLFLMRAPAGKAALLGFTYGAATFHITAKLIRDPSVPGFYRVRATAPNAAQVVPFNSAGAEVWGVPTDPRHDPIRDDVGGITFLSCANSLNKDDSRCANPLPSPDYPGAIKPFFTLPTSCEGPVATDLTVTSWQGGSDSASVLSHGQGGLNDLVGNTDCAALPFAPTLAAKPTTDVADSPSGLDVDLHLPQHESCDPGPPVVCERATSHLKDTTVRFPEGMAINPAGANGLDGCSEAELDVESTEPAHCPDASKVGTVEVETPVLDHPLPGTVYVADPYKNPFDSLLAVYLVVEDPISGIVVKIPGRVDLDPETGAISSTFAENPQAPFSDFHLDFKAGPHASLKTPPTCGSYSTESTLTPWSGTAPVQYSDHWQIAKAPNGPCASDAAALPNSPSFDAGAVSPISKSYSPFVLHLRREDGSQNFKAITLRPPPGLLAKLAGTALCPEPALAAAAAKSGKQERQSPSCPAGSRVGAVDAAAGAGPAPFHAPGIAYLAGPYKGAPLSMAIITPATAGPFDLGTILTRVALYVDSRTAEITAVSDPVPAILQGVPTDVRSVDVALDRPDFILTGTSCDPAAVSGTLTSLLDREASLLARYQLSDCSRLPFKPKMTLSLRGGTKRGSHPALTVVLRAREGDADIASLSLAMPHSEFLENAHIKTVCTRVQFAADACPAAAVYGEATVQTPLLDFPLSGHVYLRSSDNLLPDLVPDLRGPAWQPIKVESAGRTDSIHGGIRNTFDFIPDAPFTKLVTKLPGGAKGLLVNSRDICRKTYRATVKYTAHNGLAYVDHPKLAVKCKGAKPGKRGRRPHR